jgi:cytochrome b involved in lipid metabolism
MDLKTMKQLFIVQNIKYRKLFTTPRIIYGTIIVIAESATQVKDFILNHLINEGLIPPKDGNDDLYMFAHSYTWHSIIASTQYILDPSYKELMGIKHVLNNVEED